MSVILHITRLYVEWLPKEALKRMGAFKIGRRETEPRPGAVGKGSMLARLVEIERMESSLDKLKVI